MLELLKKYDRLNFIDVGHHKGHAAADFSKKVASLGKYVYCVGIDPIDHGSTTNNLFIQKAVSTKEGIRKFHLYSEQGCNSLQEMLLENKFQRPQEISKTGETEVVRSKLSKILEELNLEIIHYLKIDAQGNDRDVLESAENWLQKCLFVQIETCVAKSAEELMYKNQNTRDSDIEYMKSKGFELFDEWDHSAASCPEADLIFFNPCFYAKT
ncbi:MAG: hypothetical protein FMNOHCHN_03398 [Ignavibacteriaceae bacterium]|nr:hypothetical protein [Ignavibacteriaceae bacterium]